MRWRDAALKSDADAINSHTLLQGLFLGKKTFAREWNVWDQCLELEETRKRKSLVHCISRWRTNSEKKRCGKTRVRAMATRDSNRELEIVSTRSDYKLNSSSTSRRLVIGHRPSDFTRMQFETLDSSIAPGIMKILNSESKKKNSGFPMKVRNRVAFMIYAMFKINDIHGTIGMTEWRLKVNQIWPSGMSSPLTLGKSTVMKNALILFHSGQVHPKKKQRVTQKLRAMVTDILEDQQALTSQEKLAPKKKKRTVPVVPCKKSDGLKKWIASSGQARRTKQRQGKRT